MVKHSWTKMQEGVWWREGFTDNVWDVHVQVSYAGHPKWVPIKALYQQEWSYL